MCKSGVKAPPSVNRDKGGGDACAIGTGAGDAIY